MVTKRLRLLIFISVIGLTSFLVLTTLFPFKNTLFSGLYEQPLSKAAEGPEVPTVELKIDGFKGKVANLTSAETPVTLSWKTSNVKTCVGRAWGLVDKDQSWAGAKAAEGFFQTSQLMQNNPYVYSIDCANDFGDAAGDAVVINIGAPSLAQTPYIASFDLAGQTDLSKPIKVTPGQSVNLVWNGLGLSTPYSICVATGSWPTQYQNIAGVSVEDKLEVADQKVYRYSLFCSSESGLAQKTVTLIPN